MIKYQLDNVNPFDFEAEIHFRWLKQVIAKEGCQTGNIFYHFCSDDFLLEVNRKYLQHDYLTDIITFPLSQQPEIISGEIFISTERVRENATQMKTTFDKELSRVLVHGILHLLGYDDHSNEEKRIMRAKEDYYLSLLPQK
jgi:probable rRNA maturation factor